jgi:hypothetical protein
MHRMNVLYWEDFDSLVIPQEFGDTTADKIRRTLQLIELGWSDSEIIKRMRIDEKHLSNIRDMDDYKKKMFLEMDNYFFLNPANVDLDKIFTEVDVLEG